MDGPCGHYVKWNNSDREKRLLYFLKCGILKKNQLINTENRLVIARGGAWGMSKMGDGGQK